MIGIVDALPVLDAFENWAHGRDPRPRLPDDEVLAFLKKESASDADLAWVVEQLTSFGRRVSDVADLLQTLKSGRTPMSAQAVAAHRTRQVRVITKVDWPRVFYRLSDLCTPLDQDGWPAMDKPPNCHGDRARPSHPFARGILKQEGVSDDDVQHCVDFFREHGGYCDCEILCNIMHHLLPPDDDDDGRGPQPQLHPSAPVGDKQLA